MRQVTSFKDHEKPNPKPAIKPIEIDSGIMGSQNKHALSSLEQRLLRGQTIKSPETNPGCTLRHCGLIAIAADQDLGAVDFFRRSRDAFEPDSLERAISERLYGLALIRVQREVEGSFALERADAILDREGCATFTLE